MYIKKITFTLFLFLLFFFSKSDAQVVYIVSSADSLLKIGNVKEAIIEYKKNYEKNSKDQLNLYSYACALSINRQNDSCFKYLNLLIQLDVTMEEYLLDDILIDPDFMSIRDDKRWNDFEKHLIDILQRKNNKVLVDVEYAKKLWRMRALDQVYYYEIAISEEKVGPNSSVVMALWKLKNRINDQNQKKLESFINIKGWPKITQVGKPAADAAFLIIQHSDNEKQKKYLPTIKKLCEHKEADWGSYALMYDRIQTDNNKPQKYGSQVFFNEKTKQYELFPLEDETKVDQWRSEAGLQPLSDYIVNWNIKFEPHKK